MKVKAGKFYRFSPNLLDAIHNCAEVKDGDIVRVVNLTGCPKAGVMNQCHVEDADGRFLGMVSVNSLSDCPQPKADTATITPTELRVLKSIVTGGPLTCIDAGDDRKRKFAKLTQKLARAVAKGLKLAPGQYDIHYNRGGTAVSGETYLHTDKVEVIFEQCYLSPSPSFYYRQRDGLKGGRSGTNHWMRWANVTVPKLVAELEKVAEQPFRPF